VIVAEFGHFLPGDAVVQLLKKCAVSVVKSTFAVENVGFFVKRIYSVALFVRHQGNKIRLCSCQNYFKSALSILQLG